MKSTFGKLALYGGKNSYLAQRKYEEAGSNFKEAKRKIF